MSWFRTLAMVALVALATLLSPRAATANERFLNIANWEGYFGETTLQDFTTETGIKVNYSTFDAAEVLETKLLAGGSQFDVVFPSSDMLARLHRIGVFQPLDRSKLPNWRNLDKGFLGNLSTVDPGNTYGAPYMRGTSGIAYNRSMIAERMPDAPIDSWNLVFDPEVLSRFQDCGVFFMDAPGEVFAATLAHLGLDPNSESLEDLGKAMDLLAAVRPFIRHFNNSQIINELAKGEICIALTYSGDSSTAIWAADEADHAPDLAYVAPKEGAEIWFDVMAIPADAPHPNEAHLFINYLLRPDVIADVTNAVYYANAVNGSLPFVLDEIKNDPQIYPTEETLGKLFTLAPHSPKFLKARQRAWTRFKYGE